MADRLTSACRLPKSGREHQSCQGRKRSQCIEAFSGVQIDNYVLVRKDISLAWVYGLRPKFSDYTKNIFFVRPIYYVHFQLKVS